MKGWTVSIFGCALLTLAAAPAAQACELCRDSSAGSPTHSTTAAPQQARFNDSVLAMLGGTLAMAGLAGRAVVQAARAASPAD